MATVFRDSVKRDGKLEWYRVHTKLDREGVLYTVSFKVKARDENSAVVLAEKEFGHSFNSKLSDDFKIFKVLE